MNDRDNHQCWSEVAQSCPTLCDPMDCSLQGSSVHGIFQARVLAPVVAKLLQSCLTLCNPKDSSPPGAAVPGILQARTLEWVAVSFSYAQKWKVKVKSLSRSNSLRSHGLQPTRLLRPWDFPGKSTGVGCHCLLRESGQGGWKKGMKLCCECNFGRVGQWTQKQIAVIGTGNSMK